ncbi:MAG TPA: type II toxin-antitoxin system RelE/ParE family toxin [Candidatus Angelobacter sp.]
MWEVEYTNELELWWHGLSEDEQIELDAKVRLLEKYGPVLPRPHSDVIVTSKHANMKELRGRVVAGRRRVELRVLYAFDPRRTAILLIGGDKTGNTKWYEPYVPIADQLFDDHLEQIEQESERRREKDGKKNP